MRLAILSFLFLSVSASFAMGQLPSKTNKLIGTWKYQGGSGYEVWGKKGDELQGFAFRINKIGDTSKVEDIAIRKINKRLVYALGTNKVINDSIVHLKKNNFIGGKRKMEFFNIESNIPYSIAYSFGFLNRNKLKIKIQYSPADKPITLFLFRVKE